MNRNNKKDLYFSLEREQEIVNVPFKRYKVDGLPTCSCWVGDEKHDPEICEFLRTRNFGTTFFCAHTEEDVFSYEGRELLKPCDDCILWRS